MKAIEILRTGAGEMSPGSMFMSREYRLPGGALRERNTVREDSPLREILPDRE